MKGRTEPSAEIRHMASICWQIYVALMNMGFTKTQALIILGQWLVASPIETSGEDQS